MAIGRHRQAAAMGEVTNLCLQCYREAPKTKWTARCDCGERPFDCEYWGQVIDAIDASYAKDLRSKPFSWRVSDVGLEEEFRSRAPIAAPRFWLQNSFWRALRYAQYGTNPVLRAAASFYQPQRQWAANRAFVAGQFRNVMGADIAVDSSKDILGAIDMHRYAGEPVRILFLTRDPRGSIWSKIKHQSDHPQRDALIAAETSEWMKVNQRFITLLRNIPASDQLHVPYESLCNEPDKTVRRIETFLGLPHDDGILEPTPQPFHMIAGNKIRFSLKDFVIREDKRWRDGLTDAEMNRIQTQSRPVASQLGYDFSEPANT